MGFIKIRVIPDPKAETINEKVRINISKKSRLITDDSTSYIGLGNFVKMHLTQVKPKKQVSGILTWVHLLSTMLKKMLLDIPHKIKPEFLQWYINELCYKFNRRYFGEAIFTGLLLVIVTSENEFRYRIR